MCKGFTLMELLCAVAIVGILSAIALPSYHQYFHESERAQAKARLLVLSNTISAQRLGTQSGALPDNIETTFPHTQGHYYFSIQVNGDGVGYWLMATPLAESRQAEDGVLSLTHTGLGCWFSGNDSADGSSVCSGENVKTW